MNEIFQKALADFLAIVLPVLATSLAAVAVNYFRLLEQRIKNEKPQLYVILNVLVKQAVQAAEQLGLTGEVVDKKDYAVKYVQDMLNEYGFEEVQVGMIEAAIEAAVYAEFNKAPLPLLEG